MTRPAMYPSETPQFLRPSECSLCHHDAPLKDGSRGGFPFKYRDLARCSIVPCDAECCPNCRVICVGCDRTFCSACFGKDPWLMEEGRCADCCDTIELSPLDVAELEGK